MKMFVAASVVAFLALPISVGAADDKASSKGAAGSPAQQSFDALDKNKDGSLSRDEVKGTPQEKDFATLDKDRDGKLSRQEYGSDRGAIGATPGSAGSSGAGGSAPSRSGETPSK